jgi:mannose-6-phosphate isomerase-like protein (cupin superfamily)
MPKLSTRDAKLVEFGKAGAEATEDLGGYKAGYVKVAEDADLTPLLQGLPNDQCPCPHWGFVIAGRMWFRRGGDVESFGAGDAFYAPAGHTSGADGGSEFVIFSPTELLEPVEAHMAKRAQELANA